MTNHEARFIFTRRQALKATGCGFGMAAFAALASSVSKAAEMSETVPGILKNTHHAPRAKNVIFLFMNGGCSAIDSFDYKPELEKHDGKPLPGGELKTERKTGNLMRSPFSWKPYGQSGKMISDLWPNLAEHVDDICFIHSMVTDIPNHEPSVLLLNTGHNQPGRPSLGSWLSYGLGSLNRNLPSFVVLSPASTVTVGPPLWSSGFLPAIHQGTYISDKIEKNYDPRKVIPYIDNQRVKGPNQRGEVDLLKELNAMHLERVNEPDQEMESAIASMETAFRMQTEAPEVFDISKESEATQKLYGGTNPSRGCLMAARLVAKGVRMVQVHHGTGDPWDSHGNILLHRKAARETDQPYAALLKDLKSRGLWEDTLVVCGTEFGRTPVVETSGSGAGRDHNPFGFTVWLAGGAVKGGTSYGRTDDFGFKTAENPVHVHDLNATILHILGIDHTKLTYHFSGRDFRLTDVHGNVVKEILS